MSLKAVLLDVDGTLVDSNDLHVEAWREAFRRCGKEFTPDEIHAQIGKGGDMLILFVGKYQPRERVLPGVREAIERMKGEGLRVVLASSAKEKELKGHLAVLRIDDLIDGKTTADAAEHSKPCPISSAAKKAGIPMIGVLTGGFTDDELRQRGARAVYHDLRELTLPPAA